MGRPHKHEMDMADAVRILRASYEALPSPAHMSRLIADSHAAEARGYYNPQEDERLRDTYANYLAVRSAIWQMIRGLRPQYKTAIKGGMTVRELQGFGVAFCGAEVIVRTGEYLINLARKRDIVWQKLDEAELRYGLKRKSFTRLYRQLTSAFRMHGFYQARDYYDANTAQVMSALSGDDVRPVADILTQLNLPSSPRGDHLRRYRSFFNFSLRRRRLSSGRKAMFALFEGTGSDIADLKIPLVKHFDAPKRVKQDVIDVLKTKLQPGDVFVTRHDDAMSNLFLPGFWPHGAMYIGPPETRRARDIPDVSDGFQHSGGEAISILEAKKDGVLLRPIEETLQVDAFVVLRPNLPPDQIDIAIKRGMSHAGKLYDFIFDFASSDKLVCTEVVYRAYHGIGPIQFVLSSKAGRKCLSAEDLLNQGIANDWFDPVMIYGVGGNMLIEGSDAKQRLSGSFQATF